MILSLPIPLSPLSIILYLALFLSLSYLGASLFFPPIYQLALTLFLSLSLSPHLSYPSALSFSHFLSPLSSISLSPPFSHFPLPYRFLPSPALTHNTQRLARSAHTPRSQPRLVSLQTLSQSHNTLLNPPTHSLTHIADKENQVSLWFFQLFLFKLVRIKICTCILIFVCAYTYMTHEAYPPLFIFLKTHISIFFFPVLRAKQDLLRPTHLYSELYCA